MKKLLLMSALLVLAACGKKEEAAPAGETTGEMAPAAADTGMGGMSHDSSAMAPSSDTMMTRDSAKK